MKIPLRALFIGSLFCVVFSYIAIVTGHRGGPIVPSTQISSISFIFVILVIFLINPLFGLIRLRTLNTQELVIIAIMSILPAGLPVFGFVSEFIPMAGYLKNPNFASKYKEHVIPNVRPEFYLSFEDEESVTAYNDGYRIRDKDAFPVFIPKDGRLNEFPGEINDYFFAGNPSERKFWGEIPWDEWANPIFFWCLFIAIGILLFYALNELLFKQWYENEKLVFPHAELITSFTKIEEGRKIPAIFKSPAFYAGLSISFTLLLYNGAVAAHWLPGMDQISSLSAYHSRIDKFIAGTVLEGYGPYFTLHIFFALVGLAFLLPAEISFSIWFFFLFMRTQQWIAVMMGFGENGRSFGSNWLNQTNFMTSQGGGAMVVFGLVCLWKVRHNIFAFLYRLARPGGFKGYSSDDIKQHSTPSLLFFIASASMLIFMTWAGVSLIMALLVYVMIIIMTITMVRLVSEGGLIGFQVWFSPFHIMNNFGLYKFASIFSIKSLSAATPLFASFYLDVKTFIAPTMMTCKNIAHSAGLRRGLFPFIIAVSTALTLSISIITCLALVYDMGLENMQRWFFQGLPKSAFSTVNTIANNPETFSESAPDQMAWSGVGAATMGVILWVRRILFWFPHPIGLLMFVNPITKTYWFSFFIAWIFKSFSVKYSKPSTYQALKYAFMGLIIGELLIVSIGTLCAIMEWGNLGINLNRN